MSAYDLVNYKGTLAGFVDPETFLSLVTDFRRSISITFVNYKIKLTEADESDTFFSTMVGVCKTVRKTIAKDRVDSQEGLI
jgi:hypothetical protein